MLLRLLICFTLGAALVVLWFVIGTTGFWFPAATRTAQEPVALLAPPNDIAGDRNQHSPPADDPVSLVSTEQPASGAPPKTVQAHSRPRSSSVRTLAGGDGLRVDAEGFAPAAETVDRTGWTPPDEPPFGAVIRPREAYAPDDFEGLQPPNVRPPERRGESMDDGSEQPDVDALLGTYLEVLRLLTREGR